MLDKFATVPIIFTTILVTATLLVLDSQNSTAQTSPCDAPEASQFDFWVGKWNLTWGDSGKGLNVITKELDGCVVEENFKTLDEQHFRGNSLSVFNKNTGKWHQTWVDNSGGYLDFTGGMEGDKMILSRTAKPKGKDAFLQRMVFYNLKSDSFEWNWEKSTDDGKTWENLWQIHYVRAE